MWIRYVLVMTLCGTWLCGSVEAAEPTRISRLMSESNGSVLQAVIDWFERAHREYQDVVIKELSVPTGRSPDMPPVAAEIARAGAPTLLERVRGWLGFGPADVSVGDVASRGKPPSIPQIDKAELEARLARQVTAREEEKRRSDEEHRIAEAARAAQQGLQKASAAPAAEVPKGAPPASIAAPSQGPPAALAVSEAPKAQTPSEPQVARAEPQLLPKFETRPFAPPTTAPKPVAAAEPASSPPTARVSHPTDPAPPALNEPTMPTHWNRIPRDGGKAATAAATVAQVVPDQAERQPDRNRVARGTAGNAGLVDDAAQKLASGINKAADKLFSAKAAEVRADDAAGKPKPRGCSRAGRRVEPPATYTVKKGDTLWAIARRYYDRGVKYMRIVRANEDAISDPDLIHPCQKLFLPKRHAWLLLREQQLELT